MVKLVGNSNLKGAVLAAGLGTRLRPLTDLYPKPLVEVCGRPLIEWGLLALAEIGVQHIGVNTHYRGEQLRQHLSPERITSLSRGRAADSLQITWSPEPELLGTGGGISQLWSLLVDQTEDPSDLICLNGDALFDFDLLPLLQAHQRDKPRGTLALRAVPQGDPFGRVGVDAKGYIVRIAEVCGPRSHEEVRVGAFTGVQIVTDQVIQHLAPQFSDVFRTAHRALLAADEPILAHFVEEDSLWVDVGNRERYLEAHRAVLNKPSSRLWRDLPAPDQSGNVIYENALIGPEINLGSGVWVGERAQIIGRGSLDQSIVWSHTHKALRGEVISREILTPR